MQNIEDASTRTSCKKYVVPFSTTLYLPCSSVKAPILYERFKTFQKEKERLPLCCIAVASVGAVQIHFFVNHCILSRVQTPGWLHIAQKKPATAFFFCLNYLNIVHAHGSSISFSL